MSLKNFGGGSWFWDNILQLVGQHNCLGATVANLGCNDFKLTQLYRFVVRTLVLNQCRALTASAIGAYFINLEFALYRFVVRTLVL